MIKSPYRNLLSAVVLVSLLSGCVGTSPIRIDPGARNQRVIVVPDDARTLDDALNQVRRGGVIELKAGEYYTNIILPDRVILRGAGPGRTIVRGGDFGPTLFAYRTREALVENLTLQYSGDSPNSVVRIEDAAITLRNCAVSGGTLSGITVTGRRADPLLERVLVHDNAESGIVFLDEAQGTVRACTVWHNGLSGISVAGAEPSIEFSTVVDNLDAGIWVRGDSTAGLLGNIVVGNRWGITSVEGRGQSPGRPRLGDNLAWENDSGNFVSVLRGPGDIEQDPQFADRETGDFHVLRGSPAVLADGTPRGAWPVISPERVVRTTRVIVVPDDLPLIQDALEIARAGDTIEVRAGVYEESLIMTDGVALIGEGREQVTVRGGGPNKPVLLAHNTNNCEVEGISFTHSGQGEEYVVWVIDSELTLRDCAVLGGPLSGVQISGPASHVEISGCLIQGNRESGIVALDEARGVITHNDVSHNGLNGILISTGASLDVFHNTVVGNGGVGIWVRDGVSPRVERNITAQNEWGISGQAGEAGRRDGAPNLNNNLSHQNPAGNFVRVTRGAGDREIAPAFRNPQGRDYRVAPNSPAVLGGGVVAGAHGVADEASTWQVPDDFPTIQAALNAAWRGDEIRVRAGLYRENLQLPSGVILRGDGMSSTTVEGSDPAKATLLAERVSDSVVTGFAFHGAGGGQAYAVELVESSITLRACIIAQAALSGVLVQGGASTLEGLTIRENSESGMYVTSNAQGAIRGCTVMHNRLNGISIDRGATPAVEHNTVFENAGVGVWVRDRATPSLRYNIVSGNLWGLSADGGQDADGRSRENGSPRLEGNLLWENINEDFEAVILSDSDILADPMFVSSARADLRLRQGSPAILPDGRVRGAWPVE